MHDVASRCFRYSYFAARSTGLPVTGNLLCSNLQIAVCISLFIAELIRAQRHLIYLFRWFYFYVSEHLLFSFRFRRCYRIQARRWKYSNVYLRWSWLQTVSKFGTRVKLENNSIFISVDIFTWQIMWYFLQRYDKSNYHLFKTVLNFIV